VRCFTAPVSVAAAAAREDEQPGVFAEDGRGVAESGDPAEGGANAGAEEDRRGAVQRRPAEAARCAAEAGAGQAQRAASKAPGRGKPCSVPDCCAAHGDQRQPAQGVGRAVGQQAAAAAAAGAAVRRRRPPRARQTARARVGRVARERRQEQPGQVGPAFGNHARHGTSHTFRLEARWKACLGGNQNMRAYREIANIVITVLKRPELERISDQMLKNDILLRYDAFIERLKM